MRVDELPKKQAEFFTELQALCKKYDAYIKGCGCCGSPFGGVDGAEFENLSVSNDSLSVETDEGDAYLYTDESMYHDITVTEEVVYPDGAVNNYHFTKYTATCKKCGKTAENSYSRESVINSIEMTVCTGGSECK